MKSINRLLITLIAVGVLVATSTPAKAETVLIATHQVVSIQESEGGFAVSLSLTINNGGVDSISSVTLEIIDPMIMALPGTATLSISSLPVGSTQVNWDITTLNPLIEAGLPLSIIGNGTDSSGNPVEFFVVSEGVIQ